jgi:hypothetical protein
MGQRHQFFIEAPASVLAEGTRMTAWHNQWSYGTLPLATIKRLIKYNKDNETDHKFTTSMINVADKMIKFKDTIKKVMEFDYENSTFSVFHDETEGLRDNYRMGDNNDGVSFLIFRDGERPRYAFMTGGETGGDSMARGEVMSAEQYLSVYYPADHREGLGHRSYGLTLAAFIDEHADLMAGEEVAAHFPKMTV